MGSIGWIRMAEAGVYWKIIHSDSRAYTLKLV